MLVHSGFSCRSGHYYCYVKSPNKIWHCLNDAQVTNIWSIVNVCVCVCVCVCAYTFIWVYVKCIVLYCRYIRPVVNKYCHKKLTFFSTHEIMTIILLPVREHCSFRQVQPLLLLSLLPITPHPHPHVRTKVYNHY